MIRFECDYLEGAHPKILEALTKTNFEQTPGYGNDVYCEKASQIIKELCGRETADVHFLVGGTQANKTVIASILRPYQGVISAESGHINVHETGAIESTGHKVLALEGEDGKITAQQVEAYCIAHYEEDGPEHTIQPGMVYISHPTEYGTLYTKEELQALKEVCNHYHLPLFLDGARLGYGLMAAKTDVTLKEIAECCDVFYIGGTKVGALFGEAVVITQEILKKDFRYMIKQQGGLLAKGRLLGIQFKTLLEDGLYYEVSKKANEQAMAIKEAFAKTGHSFLYNSYTNQQFPILSHDEIEKLEQKYTFSFWCKVDAEHSAVRFCTSWATKDENVAQLIKDIEALV